MTMAENEKPSIMPMRIMRLGLPPADTVGRLLVRHAVYGFMIGEMLPAATGKPNLLCAIGIEPTPARTPICIMAIGTEAPKFIEWMPLITSESAVDRVRATAAERRRDA